VTLKYDPSAATEEPANRPVLESGSYTATMTACRVNDRNEYEIDWTVYRGSDEVYLRQWLDMQKGFHVHHLKCIASHLSQMDAFNTGSFNPASGVNRNFGLKVTKKEARNKPGTFRNWVDGIDPTPAKSASQTPPSERPGGNHTPVDDDDVPF